MARIRRLFRSQAPMEPKKLEVVQEIEVWVIEDLKHFKVVEFSPQKRTVKIRHLYHPQYRVDFHLQFPYMLFGYIKKHKLCVGFTKEPWHNEVRVFFPSLPNIYSEWYSCQDVKEHFHPTIELFWQTEFTHNLEYKGSNIANEFLGYKNWCTLNLNQVFEKMTKHWHNVSYNTWLFQCGLVNKQLNKRKRNPKKIPSVGVTVKW